MAPTPSTRAQSRHSGGFVRSTPGSHSLERGLALLRAFRLGVQVLGNAELATRTGLPRPTVTGSRVRWWTPAFCCTTTRCRATGWRLCA